MATALQSLCFTARRCQCRTGAHRYAIKSIGRRRPFSTTPFQWEGRNATEAAVRDLVKKSISSTSGATVSEYEAQLESLEAEMLLSPEDRREFEERAEAHAAKILSTLPSTVPHRSLKKPKQTFMNLGEEIPFEDNDDSLDDEDDISSLGHGELEQHRELRHYARLAAWEMPLLAKMAKPFEPPTVDEPLRFRYTTYMGEQHPAEKKVVLEFCPADMRDLTMIQRDKLRKLVGARYNPETDIVRMSSEMFETQAQNKRYLGDLVDSLLQEAKDPTDTFEDVPLDTRHHVFKTKPKFPKEWRLTEERRAELAASRENAELKDQRRMLTGAIVDGIKQIEIALARPPSAREALPEMVMVGKGKGRAVKGKKVAIRR